MKTKGISLIVLVITILVLAILATTVIISLSNTNVLEQAGNAVTKNNIQAMKEAVSLQVTSHMANHNGKIEPLQLASDLNSEFGSEGYTITQTNGVISIENGEKTICLEVSGTGIVTVKSDTQELLPGLYETGTTNMIMSWDEIKATYPSAFDGDNICGNVDSQSSYLGELAGDLVIGSEMTQIGDFAFINCESLTNITIPNSVTQIGMGAFAMCNALTTATIPDSVIQMGVGAFLKCESLTNVKISNCITQIASRAFAMCTALENVTIPDRVTLIDAEAFVKCESFTNITIPDSVAEIGISAFGGCKSLTNITIPGSVTEIPYMTFVMCESLTTVTISDGVTEIGSTSFCQCPSLTTVTIPDSVTKIWVNAFAECTALNTINFKGTEAQWNAINKSDAEIPASCTINYNYGG